MKQNKRAEWIYISAFLVLTIFLIWHGYWFFSFLAVVGVYLFHLIFMSDHIYYSPSSDYRYNIKSSIYISISLTNNIITIQKDYLDSIDSCFIPVVIQSSIFGRFFDPYIELKLNDKKSRQYFERGANGVRFLNISSYLPLLKGNNTTLKIKSVACQIMHNGAQAMGFANADYLKKSTLILSPHADDAELAAFGYYKQADTIFIATITAGESEAQQYLNVTGNSQEAALLKGRLRAWDSITVPLWARKQNCAVQLGYACSSLSIMHQSPEIPITSKGTGKNTTNEYRQFNAIKLSSDDDSLNTWSNLIADLKELLIAQQPEVIITPHPLLDAHSDHQYVTCAIVEACTELKYAPIFLCYVNHHHQTDMYPFGLEHADVPLPPYFSDEFISDKIFSLELSIKDQQDKIMALQMMHDLQRPIKFKKKLRHLLQRAVGRSSYPYGEDDYFRKSIRNQELFWMMNFEEINLMVKSKS